MARSPSSNLAAIFPADLPLIPDPCGMDKLSVYLDMVETWNKKLNLVGFADKAKILRELVCDSFFLAHFLSSLWPSFSGEIWDPGAGAGLPGIPLRIVWEQGTYTMIERREKRAIFLANVLSRLQLPRTTIVKGGVEDFLRPEAKADCVISRAFMPWPQLLQLFYPYVNNLVVIMANQPPPDTPWRLVDKYQYKISGKDRWFWALSPV